MNVPNRTENSKPNRKRRKKNKACDAKEGQFTFGSKHNGARETSRKELGAETVPEAKEAMATEDGAEESSERRRRTRGAMSLEANPRREEKRKEKGREQKKKKRKGVT